MITDLPEQSAQAFGPWNPGIESALPGEFLHLTTVFSSANVSSSIVELQEIKSFCGLPLGPRKNIAQVLKPVLGWISKYSDLAPPSRIARRLAPAFILRTAASVRTFTTDRASLG